MNSKLQSDRIAPKTVQLRAARLLASQLDKTKNDSLDASVAKLFVGESLISAARDMVQIHGGYGCMVEYEVERALRDAMAGTLYSGTAEMQRMAGFVRVENA
jgi:alkylation response protein AidB-like acyl-CoA dehydrogenase